MDISDPKQRRKAVVELHAEGWSVTSISTYLQTPRQVIYRVLKRWVAEGEAGLVEQSQAPRKPARGPYAAPGARLAQGTHVSACCTRPDSLCRPLHASPGSARLRQTAQVAVL